MTYLDSCTAIFTIYAAGWLSRDFTQHASEPFSTLRLWLVDPETQETVSGVEHVEE